MLDAAASYRCMQLKEKRVIQTKENGEKPHFGSDLGALSPSSVRQIFISKIWLCQSLDITVSYHHIKYQKKLMNQS